MYMLQSLLHNRSLILIILDPSWYNRIPGLYSVNIIILTLNKNVNMHN